MPKQTETTIIPQIVVAERGEFKDDSDPNAEAQEAWALRIIDPPEMWLVVLTPEQKDSIIRAWTGGIEIAKSLPPRMDVPRQAT